MSTKAGILRFVRCALLRNSYGERETNEIIVFRNGGRLRLFENWAYEGYRINTTSFYKYMGLLFTLNYHRPLLNFNLEPRLKKQYLL